MIPIRLYFLTTWCPAVQISSSSCISGRKIQIFSTFFAIHHGGHQKPISSFPGFNARKCARRYFHWWPVSCCEWVVKYLDKTTNFDKYRQQVQTNTLYNDYLDTQAEVGTQKWGIMLSGKMYAVTKIEFDSCQNPGMCRIQFCGLKACDVHSTVLVVNDCSLLF